jgi:hypothetical protein
MSRIADRVLHRNGHQDDEQPSEADLDLEVIKKERWLQNVKIERFYKTDKASFQGCRQSRVFTQDEASNPDLIGFSECRSVAIRQTVQTCLNSDMSEIL